MSPGPVGAVLMRPSRGRGPRSAPITTCAAGGEVVGPDRLRTARRGGGRGGSAVGGPRAPARPASP